MRIQFIRHGQTAGNLQRAYIGRTDEPLCAQGIAALQRRQQQGCYEKPQRLYCSPMLRCRQTCQLLFPEQTALVVEALRETDFGIFEGQSYEQLKDNRAYQRWLDSGCTGPIPQGERRAAFQQRCCTAFLQLLKQEADADQLTLVVHGGVIMALLEQFAQPRQDFYAYRLDNGAACVYRWDGAWPVILRQE